MYSRSLTLGTHVQRVLGLCVYNYSGLGNDAAHERYQQLQCNNRLCDFAKMMEFKSKKLARPSCMAKPIHKSWLFGVLHMCTHSTGCRPQTDPASYRARRARAKPSTNPDCLRLLACLPLPLLSAPDMQSSYALINTC